MLYISIVKLLKDFALLNSFIFFVLLSDINVVLSGFSQKYFINRLGLKYMFSYINSLVSEHPNFKKKPYNPMNIHLLLVLYILHICMYANNFFLTVFYNYFNDTMPFRFVYRTADISALSCSLD